jgi:hypothetical protein
MHCGSRARRLQPSAQPHAPTLAAPLFVPAPTPIAEYVGFPSLLPVLYYAEDRSLIAAPGSACLDADRNVDFNAPRTLPHPQAIDARAKRKSIRLGISSGGMNGVLISLEEDPRTTAELDRLFATPFGRWHPERIRFTPQELRGEFDSRALVRWQRLQVERSQAPGISAPRRPEPSPCANICA